MQGLADAIAAATLKYLKMTSNLKVNPRLASLLADANLKSVIDHFVNLLDLPRNELYRSANETDNQLIPRLRYRRPRLHYSLTASTSTSIST